MFVASDTSESEPIKLEIPKCKSIEFSISVTEAIIGSILNPVISLTIFIVLESKGSDTAIFKVR